MSLGDLLAQFDDDERVAGLLQELGDAQWRAKLSSGSLSPQDFARSAVARFTAEAGDEDWMSLLSSLNRASDPGALCLRRMIDWSLSRDLMEKAR